MNNSRPFDAFLSYSSQDRPVVLEVADQLKNLGCTCFLDQWYLTPGRDWVGALEMALAASRSSFRHSFAPTNRALNLGFRLVLSPSGVTPEAGERELGEAIGRRDEGSAAEPALALP